VGNRRKMYHVGIIKSSNVNSLKKKINRREKKKRRRNLQKKKTHVMSPAIVPENISTSSLTLPLKRWDLIFFGRVAYLLPKNRSWQK
jgi:hypothetical protein